MAVLAGAETSLPLHIVGLGHGRQLSGLATQLTSLAKNDFGLSVIFPNFAVNFDLPARQLTDVANVPQVAGEHHHREWAFAVVLAEIQVGSAASAFSDGHHLGGNTGSVSDMLRGLIQENTGGL